MSRCMGRVAINMDRETLREENVIPHRGEVMMWGGGDDLGREIVESDISANFYDPPFSKRTGYPDEVPFGIFGIAEKAAGFTARSKFGEGV